MSSEAARDAPSIERSGGPKRRRGRPRRFVTREAIAVVDQAIRERGRCVSVIELWRRTGIPRKRLTRYVGRRLRRAARSRLQLHWPTSGAVWAFDWTQLEEPLAWTGIHARTGAARHALVVRDLASSMMLAAWPAAHATAETAACVLEALFIVHGAPLVLKSDNGGNVIGGRVPELLAEWDVVSLRSPPRTPGYNGSIEASAGSIKRRLARILDDSNPRNPRNPTNQRMPTIDDLEEARREANATARPKGVNGPTPEAMWAERQAPTAIDRATLAVAIDAALRVELERRGLLPPIIESNAPPLPEPSLAGILSTLGTHQRANVVRRAISRSLEATGHLIIRRPALSST